MTDKFEVVSSNASKYRVGSRLRPWSWCSGRIPIFRVLFNNYKDCIL